MHSKTTTKFRVLLASAPPSVQLKANAAYALWAKNPDHPSLRFKKVHHTLPIYPVRIDLAWLTSRLREVTISSLSTVGLDIITKPYVEFSI